MGPSLHPRSEWFPFQWADLLGKSDSQTQKRTAHCHRWWLRGGGTLEKSALLPKRKRQKKETFLCLVLLHPDKELEALARVALSLKQNNLTEARALRCDIWSLPYLWTACYMKELISSLLKPIRIGCFCYQQPGKTLL